VKEVAKHLSEVLKIAMPILRDIDSAEARVPPAPGKWSPIQLIGHLIDSANNNQQKIIRLVRNPEVQFVGYAQDEWVEVQQYHKAKWTETIEFWMHINRHLAHLIDHLPSDALSHAIHIDGVGPFRLDFIVSDYVEHVKHHLLQIDPSMPLLSKFENVY